MDEHIVRNYFTVAGISFYRSQEFSRQKLGFEPVSRFGVGILSCFMVSDTLAVKTYRDPDCGPPLAYNDRQMPGAAEHQAKRLLLKVPGVDRQFIVKDLIDPFEVGTEITLHVRASKVRKPESSPEQASADGEHMFRRCLEVTEYLSKIAGFVEFPIYVEESWPGLDKPQRTLILHPDQDAKAEVAQFDGKVAIRQLTRAYPWHRVTDSESVQAAEQQLEADCLELKQILAEEGYEGWVVFPKPKNEDWDFTNEELRNLTRYAGYQILWRNRQAGQGTGQQITWTVPNQYLEIKDFPRQVLLGVYRDGILLEEIATANLRRQAQSLPLPMIHVNLPTLGTPRPNLARTNLSVRDEKWDDELWSAIERHLSQTQVAPALLMPPTERLYRLGWIAAVYRIAAPELSKMVPDSKTMSVWLQTGGNLVIREGLLADGEDVPLVPSELEYGARLLASHCWLHTTGTYFKVGWLGPDSLVVDVSGLGEPLAAAGELMQQWTIKRLIPSRLQFLTPLQGRNTPIAQAVSSVMSYADEESLQEVSKIASDRLKLLTDPKIVEVLQLAVSDPSKLGPIQRKVLAVAISLSQQKPALLPIPFSPPFADFCGTNDGDFNLLHPVGLAVWRCLAGRAIAEREGRLPRSVARRLDELSNGVLFSTFDRNLWSHFQIVSVREFASTLFALVVEYQLLEDFTKPTLPDEANWAPKIVPSQPHTVDLPLRERVYQIEQLQSPVGRLLT